MLYNKQSLLLHFCMVSVNIGIQLNVAIVPLAVTLSL